MLISMKVHKPGVKVPEKDTHGGQGSSKVAWCWAFKDHVGRGSGTFIWVSVVREKKDPPENCQNMKEWHKSDYFLLPLVYPLPE